MTAQQKKFDRFRLVFNHERPHEALANETPGSIYVPSTRLLPSRVGSFQYPKSFQTRRANNGGDITWHKGRVFVSEVFRNEEIGLEKMDENVHRVVFCNTELGEFMSAEMRFRPVLRAWVCLKSSRKWREYLLDRLLSGAVPIQTPSIARLPNRNTGWSNAKTVSQSP